MKLNLSSPWIIFYREIEALFAQDNDVSVKVDNDAYEITVYVEDSIKADALAKLLPTERTFGNVTATVKVVPANEPNILDTYRAAFNGNPAFAGVYESDGAFAGFKYVIFEPDVVQYFADDMTDYRGKCNTLYQDIAKDIFPPVDGLFYCTE